MFYPSNWIHSFPTHFQWSNATLVTKGMAPYGAVALGEIDWVVQRLHERMDQPEAWWEEWSRVAAQVERAGDAAAADGRSATAGNCYLRAGNYYYTAERMVPPGEKKLDIYRKALRCYQEGLRRRHPGIEFIDVPCERSAPERGAGAPVSRGCDRAGAHEPAVSGSGASPSAGALPAYFLKSPVAKGRAPTVVLFDGLDNCKEMSVLFAGLELAFRGFHTLAIDGPGQGEALRLRNLPARYDYEVPGTAAYEYVASRPDVDPERVAIMAYSAGGYYAPRAAAFEPRYAACIAWGPHYDYHAVWEKRWAAMKEDGISVATSHFQLPWVLGTPDMETAMEKLKKFTLAGVADRIVCPMLILWGEEDKLTPREVARQLHDAVGSKDRTLKIFTSEEGGAEHCQVDNRQIGTDYVCDWLVQRMLPA